MSLFISLIVSITMTASTNVSIENVSKKKEKKNEECNFLKIF